MPSVQEEVALAPACKEPKTLHGGPSPAEWLCDGSIGVVYLLPVLDIDVPTGIKCLAPKPELRPWIFFPLVLYSMQSPLSEVLGMKAVVFLHFYSPVRFLD